MNWKIYWDSLANSTDDLLSGDWTYVSEERYVERIKYLGETLNINKDDILIDVGCGSGFFLRYYLQNIAYNYIGIDFSLELLRRGMRKVGNNSNYCFVQATCNDIPLKSSSINKMLINSITHYLCEKEFKEMICEINRLLKKGGVCLLGDIQSNTPVESDCKGSEGAGLLRKIKLFLRKFGFFVWIYSALMSLLTDYKRGFKIHRSKTNKFEQNVVLEWIANVNNELSCKVLSQNRFSVYPNRYDILIKK